MWRNESPGGSGEIEWITVSVRGPSRQEMQSQFLEGSGSCDFVGSVRVRSIIEDEVVIPGDRSRGFDTDASVGLAMEDRVDRCRPGPRISRALHDQSEPGGWDRLAADRARSPGRLWTGIPGGGLDTASTQGSGRWGRILDRSNARAFINTSRPASRRRGGGRHSDRGSEGGFSGRGMGVPPVCRAGAASGGGSFPELSSLGTSVSSVTRTGGDGLALCGSGWEGLVDR